MPPQDLEQQDIAFRPAPELLAWVQKNILAEDGPLHNPEHKHLNHADLEFMWASQGFTKAGRQVAGTAEEVTFRAGGWQKGRQVSQMVEWFGRIPDYLITLDASYCRQCEDAEFCALVEHELYHIAQVEGAFGPEWKKDGTPKIAIRGHDVEEFVGVVRRYGVGGPEGSISRLVAAANKAPEVSRVAMAAACGTCLRRVA
ncbi:MAG TPA: putative metallopeptidase [Roseateles sp.]|uniref:putative metallopeptidase n=1 Tax=Roseateles sp. TaxID=1971397 RepID=UPI002ED969E9